MCGNRAAVFSRHGLQGIPKSAVAPKFWRSLKTLRNGINFGPPVRRCPLLVGVHKADMTTVLGDVRFWGYNGHCANWSPCPLLTQSGLRIRGDLRVDRREAA